MAQASIQSWASPARSAPSTTVDPDTPCSVCILGESVFVHVCTDALSLLNLQPSGIFGAGVMIPVAERQ